MLYMGLLGNYFYFVLFPFNKKKQQQKKPKLVTKIQRVFQITF